MNQIYVNLEQIYIRSRVNLKVGDHIEDDRPESFTFKCQLKVIDHDEYGAVKLRLFMPEEYVDSNSVAGRIIK